MLQTLNMRIAQGTFCSLPLLFNEPSPVDSSGYSGHQDVVIDSIKELLQVYLNDPSLAATYKWASWKVD